MSDCDSGIKDLLLEKHKKSSKEKKLKRRSRSPHESKKRSRSRSQSRKSPSKSHGSKQHRSRHRSRDRSSPVLTTEERDERTVFAWQLSNRIRESDLFTFFSQAGTVRCAKIIYDNKTGRAKGIAYIEFREKDSVTKALCLAGQRLLGVPIQIQSTFAERMRIGNLPIPQPPAQIQKKSLTLYVGSLHYSITDDMVKGIFEPFGQIESVKMMRDSATSRSMGYGFVTYANEEEGLKALEQLNGFEIAGRPIKVNYGQPGVSRNEYVGTDDDLGERATRINANNRYQLMAKLAEGKDMPQPNKLPGNAADSTSMALPLGSQCFMLGNMFDSNTCTDSQLNEIRDDVLEECNKFGGALHIHIDRKNAQGQIYVKASSIAVANQCVQLMHGRYFSGRLINASYVPAQNYFELFPEAVKANTLLKSSSS